MYVGTAAGSNAPKGLGGFGVGMTLGLVILGAGPLTGAALNPARHFGTAIASGYLDNIWIYWVGPILGGIIGISLLFKILSSDD